MLKVTGLRKAFGGVVALDGVSLDVRPGATFGLIGPNGAGKTTLFNVVSGVLRPTAGSVHLDGRSLDGLSQDAIARLGVARTFQNLQVFAGMSALDNVLTGCHGHGRTGLLGAALRTPSARREEARLRERAMAELAFVGLQERAEEPAASLPPGGQRLVEIARALVASPRILLLDEPAAGLTTRETEVLGDLVGRIAARGLTVVMIEHDMSLVMGVCDPVAVLNEGRLIALDSPEAVQANPQVVAAYLGEEEGAEA
jgi:ABC-type branched-subunit amino acid transport system ATPase component